MRKLPGLTRFGNIVLRYGVTQDTDLWNWRKSIVEGDIDRRNGSIVLLDDNRTPGACAGSSETAGSASGKARR